VELESIRWEPLVLISLRSLRRRFYSKFVPVNLSIIKKRDGTNIIALLHFISFFVHLVIHFDLRDFFHAMFILHTCNELWLIVAFFFLTPLL